MTKGANLREESLGMGDLHFGTVNNKWQDSEVSDTSNALKHATVYGGKRSDDR